MIKRSHNHPVQAAVQQISFGEDSIVTELVSGSGSIVIFPNEKFGIDNAKLLNSNGTFRADVEIPVPFRLGIGFSDAYYISNELTAIFVDKGRDFAFVVDETSGKVKRYYETR
jgi:hypothetical protein